MKIIKMFIQHYTAFCKLFDPVLSYLFCFCTQTPDKNSELINQLQQEVALKNIEHTQQKQDYEDLLVLLEDQDSKIKKFKVRLKYHMNRCIPAGKIAKTHTLEECIFV